MAHVTRVTRPATPEDVPVIRGILAAHGNDGPVTRVDIVGPYVRHLVTRHRTLLTEEDGVAVAFGAVVDAGLAVHLADLFVVPDRLGQGLGRPLLAALLADAPWRTTFASDDPRALPIYVRAGMTPLWPTLHVEGDATSLAMPPGLDVVAALPDELAALELAWTGPTAATTTGSGRPRPMQIRFSSLTAMARSRWRSAGRGRCPTCGSSTGCECARARTRCLPCWPRSAARTAAPGWSPACSVPTRCCRRSWILAST